MEMTRGPWAGAFLAVKVRATTTNPSDWALAFGGGGFPAGLVVDQTPLAISQHEMLVATCDGLAP